MNQRTLGISLGILTLAIGVGVLWTSQRATIEKVPSVTGASEKAVSAPVKKAAEQKIEAPAAQVKSTESTKPKIAEVEKNTYNGMDPEDQPRAFYVRDFMNSWKLPAGFIADGIMATPEGLQLVPLAEGETGLRQGTLISAAEMFDFPSNALAPLWKENVPAGTDIMVEMQVSPNGEDWGAWQYIGIDNDSHGQIASHYPNGKPNPNYGYTPGGLLVWGDMQFNHMRYRITMFSENEDTPTIEGFRGFYQDSTMGEGRVATVADLDSDIIGATTNRTPSKPEETIVYNPTHNPDEHLELDEQTSQDVKQNGK